MARVWATTEYLNICKLCAQLAAQGKLCIVRAVEEGIIASAC